MDAVPVHAVPVTAIETDPFFVNFLIPVFIFRIDLYFTLLLKISSFLKDTFLILIKRSFNFQENLDDKNEEKGKVEWLFYLILISQWYRIDWSREVSIFKEIWMMKKKEKLKKLSDYLIWSSYRNDIESIDRERFQFSRKFGWQRWRKRKSWRNSVII